ncbi:hypothetical protein KIN20_022324 [Parelaphostrongylus tenuis]|uniref:Uncharacterized protein n=1 Tax=Parelaphostrongylus tenuis TaxID=148309 RepID=A0AAD5N5H7_PARTN|nr:hypothetical protein KIN20_022324 [Parelaphostrongylus tenuis]
MENAVTPWEVDNDQLGGHDYAELSSFLQLSRFGIVSDEPGPANCELAMLRWAFRYVPGPDV